MKIDNIDDFDPKNTIGNCLSLFMDNPEAIKAFYEAKNKINEKSKSAE